MFLLFSNWYFQVNKMFFFAWVYPSSDNHGCEKWVPPTTVAFQMKPFSTSTIYGRKSTLQGTNISPFFTGTFESTISLFPVFEILVIVPLKRFFSRYFSREKNPISATKVPRFPVDPRRSDYEIDQGDHLHGPKSGWNNAVVVFSPPSQ